MYLCIDVGGTKTLVASFSLRGKLLQSLRFPTPPDQDRFFIELTDTLTTRFDLTRLRAIALALPGPVQHGHPVFFGNLPWHPSDIGAYLKQTFHVPTVVINDARASALAEGRRFHYGRSLFITLSTGIGVGVVSRGRLDDNYMTYEPGHAKFTWDGRTQEWEDIASAQAVSRAYDAFVDQIADPDAWLTNIPHRIALGLSSAIETVRPARIIFGGPLGEMLPRYSAPLRTILAHNLPRRYRLRFIKTKYGTESVLYGLYFLARAARH
jgi:predicted NBD/HSP70 family sugar kinase